MNWRRLVLLLMLLPVTVGVFAMHTLGHPHETPGASSVPMLASMPDLANSTHAARTDAAGAGTVDSSDQPGIPAHLADLSVLRI